MFVQPFGFNHNHLRVRSQRGVSALLLAMALLLGSAFLIEDASAATFAGYVRGDANADGSLSIADASFPLNWVFLGGATPPCLDAADSNDDGKVNIADALYSLGFIFLGKLDPPAPFPDCGGDPTADGLGCESYPACTVETAPVVINELLLRPSGPAGTILDAQWVELSNTSGEAQDLTGWSLVGPSGDTLADLDGWVLPAGSLLTVFFADFSDDSDFSDGAGRYFVSSVSRPFDHEAGEVGLYRDELSGDLVDLVAWGSRPDAEKGSAMNDAISLGLWEGDVRVDLAHPGIGSVVLPGESIGRDRDGTDSNRPTDFTDHGGDHSFIAGLGSPNDALQIMPSWVLSKKRPSYHANLMLVLRGFQVTDTFVENEEIVRSASRVEGRAEHTFMTETDMLGPITFVGQSDASWVWDATGTLIEVVDISIYPVGEPDSELAMSSHFERRLTRRSLGTTNTAQGRMLTASGEVIHALDMAIDTEHLANDTYLSSGSYTVTAGLGSDPLTVDFERVEAIDLNNRASGETTATLLSGDSLSTLETIYTRPLHEDVGTAFFIQQLDPLIECDATYDRFRLTRDGKVFELASGSGWTYVMKTGGPPMGFPGTPSMPATYSYDWSLDLVAADGERIDLTLTGGETDIGVLVSTNFTMGTGRLFRATIDPDIATGLGTIAKVGIGIAVVSLAVGIYNAVAKDTTKPSVTITPQSTGCDTTKGWASVLVRAEDTGSEPDPTSMDVDLDEPPSGASHTQGTASPSFGNSEIVGVTDTIENTSTSPITVRIEVTVQDKKGNTATVLSPPITVPGRKTTQVSLNNLNAGSATPGAQVSVTGEVNRGTAPYSVAVTHPFGTTTVTTSEASFSASFPVPIQATVGDYGYFVTVTDAAGGSFSTESLFTVAAPQPLVLQITDSGRGGPGETALIAGVIEGGTAPYFVTIQLPWRPVVNLEVLSSSYEVEVQVPLGYPIGFFFTTHTVVDAREQTTFAETLFWVSPF